MGLEGGTEELLTAPTVNNDDSAQLKQNEVDIAEPLLKDPNGPVEDKDLEKEIMEIAA